VAGYTEMVYPQTVTHPSINRVRRRVTTLIETNALPLSQATTAVSHVAHADNLQRVSCVLYSIKYTNTAPRPISQYEI